LLLAAFVLGLAGSTLLYAFRVELTNYFIALLQRDVGGDTIGLAQRIPLGRTSELRGSTKRMVRLDGPAAPRYLRAQVFDAISWPPKTLALLTIVALVLILGSFLVLAHFSGSPPGSTYEPAHMENGKFVPGQTR
jgi:hypothetical protein